MRQSWIVLFLVALLGLAIGCGRSEPTAFNDIADDLNNARSGSLNGAATNFEYPDASMPLEAFEPAHEGMGAGQGGDQFDHIVENPFQRVTDTPLSTLSIDVDTASYSKTRMFLLQHGALPPPDAVRIEEFVNYFDYDYEGPTDEHPFAANVELAECPWKPGHRLARIGIKGKEIQQDERRKTNLVFLIDCSGSMSPGNKLPLVKRGMEMLVEQLDERDSISIAVYAGTADLILPPTSGAEKQKILRAISRVQSGGATAGSAGLEVAYNAALDNFVEGGVNRVMLCTDGDFNVGSTSQGDLVRQVEEYSQQNVFMTVLGFGIGNHNDAMLEEISNKGNGNYAFIDTELEARKVLVEQLSGTLETIAKDVKIQVEFNPAKVLAYRLIGYQNRKLAAEDFRDDKKDAGEIGAGHRVTALYEVVPVGVETDVTLPKVEPLKYQTQTEPSPAAESDEWMTVNIRYKLPESDTSTPISYPIEGYEQAFTKATKDFQFAAAVASFGMLLRGSEFKGEATYESVLETAKSAMGEDEYGYRGEFVSMVKRARVLAK